MLIPYWDPQLDTPGDEVSWEPLYPHPVNNISLAINLTLSPNKERSSHGHLSIGSLWTRHHQQKSPYRYTILRSSSRDTWPVNDDQVNDNLLDSTSGVCNKSAHYDLATRQSWVVKNSWSPQHCSHTLGAMFTSSRDLLLHSDFWKTYVLMDILDCDCHCWHHGRWGSIWVLLFVVVW